ncbi:RNA polymerase sigma factor [Microvirga guangxiensis]|uniref:RNA polymerase sigma factor n=1 Tax=Microvirga guangxiensis TaxID=549386 RepID=UPI000B8664BD|nr:RNA polymerase sigma factor [Microvirga guangxiensis]
MAAIGHELVSLLPRLRRFALALTRSPSLADDMVQSACEKALLNAEQWTPGTRLDAWVFRILHNAWIDHLRQHKADVILDDVRNHEDRLMDHSHGEHEVISKLTLTDVQRAIAELPTEQREVLVLVCVEDLAYREAAEILGVPVGTVMSRLARARKRIFEATHAA